MSIACALADLLCLAENRPQNLLKKQEALSKKNLNKNIQWHLIGQLQTNKINAILGKTALIHSVSSLKLAQSIDKRSRREKIITEILLQVNTSGETSKDGFSPELLLASTEELKNLQMLKIKGLMCMAPKTKDTTIIRNTFRECRLLRDILEPLLGNLPELSMGMSLDFSIAIEEGATMVRIGSKLFEGIQP
jgi:pyridoxal phosphate enzyme (YggS family)